MINALLKYIILTAITTYENKNLQLNNNNGSPDLLVSFNIKRHLLYKKEKPLNNTKLNIKIYISPIHRNDILKIPSQQGWGFKIKIKDFLKIIKNKHFPCLSLITR